MNCKLDKRGVLGGDMMTSSKREKEGGEEIP